MVLAGGSEAAAWKAELLSAAGAGGRGVRARTLPEDLPALAAAPPGGARRLTSPATGGRDDLTGAALAIGAHRGRRGRARVSQAPPSPKGVPITHRRQAGLFRLRLREAMVNRFPPLVVGISTDGASLVFGQAVRAPRSRR